MADQQRGDGCQERERAHSTGSLEKASASRNNNGPRGGRSCGTGIAYPEARSQWLIRWPEFRAAYLSGRPLPIAGCFSVVGVQRGPGDWLPCTAAFSTRSVAPSLPPAPWRGSRASGRSHRVPRPSPRNGEHRSAQRATGQGCFSVARRQAPQKGTPRVGPFRERRPRGSSTETTTSDFPSQMPICPG